MLISSVLTLCLQAINVHAQWQHASRADFESIVESSELTLAAFVVVAILPQYRAPGREMPDL
jgi:hypothetical protein